MGTKTKLVLSNIVKQNQLREVQKETLRTLAETVSLTGGPYGSNTMILMDDTGNGLMNEFSKDGKKVLESIKFYDPLECSIKEEIVSAAKHLVTTVGDGTTSLTKMCYYIFEGLCTAKEEHPETPMFEILDAFKEATKLVQDKIREHGREITIDDIYKICMVSTDGNKELSENISSIYKEYGKDVYIDLGVSNTVDNIVKQYDGLTLERGYASPAYINTSDGKSVINHPRLYCFEDPVDTPELIGFLSTIIYENIFKRITNREQEIPTVIMAPSISRDAATVLEEAEKLMYGFSGLSKPKLSIITGLHRDIDFYSDLTMLCGCPTIKKYINQDIQKKDQEEGKAPTPETICDWYGEVEEVISDSEKTTFINPKLMFTEDENGETKYSSTYNGLIEFLSTQLKYEEENNGGIGVIGNLKRRLNSLKTNYVEYFIGGISMADRDSVRDLAEDAILNCRSACKNGVGYGAGFEGLYASHVLLNDNDIPNIVKESICIIFEAFNKSIKQLYSTAMAENRVDTIYMKSLAQEMPINLRTMEFTGDVLCSIDCDIMILETIKKIITVMFNTNQALLVSPLNNKYVDKDDID